MVDELMIDEKSEILVTVNRFIVVSQELGFLQRASRNN